MMDLSFPPLMYGEPASSDAFQHACLKAIQGCDAGMVAYHLTANKLGAALVFAPEIPLKDAVAMLPICAIGFQNALGALAPPEVAVHLEWTGGIKLLEAWARHTLNWIGRFEDDGIKPAHDEWRGLAHGIGEELEQGGQIGTFLGIDERFGMLFRVGSETTLIPLTTILDDT